MKSEHTAKIKTEKTDKDSTKMGIKFFKDMPRDIRNEIASYLSLRDLAKLNAVSKEFHGPVAKPEYEFVGYNRRWSNKVYHKMMAPVDKLLDKSLAPRTNPILGLGLFCAAGAMLLPTITAAALAQPPTSLAGSIKEKIEKHKINKKKKKILPFTGEQITFNGKKY